MKRTIQFYITVGSAWAGEMTPIGGEPKTVIIEFETDNEHPLEDAEAELKNKMKGQSYHIWYWDWIE